MSIDELIAAKVAEAVAQYQAEQTKAAEAARLAEEAAALAAAERRAGMTDARHRRTLRAFADDDRRMRGLLKRRDAARGRVRERSERARAAAAEEWAGAQAWIEQRAADRDGDG